MNAKDADFIIERQLREESTQQFDFLLPVDQLVASVMTVISELESLRCHFPSEKTVFISPSRSEIWLGDELNQFYEQCHTLLARGASGEELAAHTGMSLDRVLLNLHRLRSSSLITPCRAVTSALQTRAGEPRTRLSLFKTPRLRPPAGQVPCISFEQVPPTIVEEPTTGIEKAIQGSFVPAESFYFPPARSEESEPSSSFPTSAHPVSQASRSNVSTDLSQVRIKRPVQGMASKLLGRLARLCRIEVAT
ncbi:MAG: hypothetical protein ACAI35_25415 [Candidatus Methylacidiphilales bacterium]|nr:hypothetical protein [Candidatus Methylacidiphilales bacterium]